MTTTFEKSQFYAVICARETARFENLVNDPSIHEVADSPPVFFPWQTRYRQIADLKHIDTGGSFGTYLHLAVTHGCDVDMIRGLVRYGTPLSQRDAIGCTFMDLVQSKGDQSQPDKFQVSKFMNDYIMDALRDGEVEIIRDLLTDRWGHWPTQTIPFLDKFKEAPLYFRGINGERLSDGSKDIIRENLDTKEIWSFNEKYDCEMTDHHFHAIFSPNQYLEKLLEAEKDGQHWEEILKGVKEQDMMGRSSLHYLISVEGDTQYKEKVRHLAERCNVIDLKDKKGFTPLDYCEDRATIVMDSLKEWFTNISDYAYFFKHDDLHMYENLDDKSGSNLILNDMKHLTFVDFTGRSHSQKMTIYGKAEELQRMLHRMGDLNIRTHKDAWGRTVYHYAVMFHNKTLEGLLNIVKRKKDKESIRKGKCRDYQGHTVEDYRLSATDGEQLRKRMLDTCNLLQRYYMICKSEGLYENKKQTEESENKKVERDIDDHEEMSLLLDNAELPTNKKWTYMSWMPWLRNSKGISTVTGLMVDKDINISAYTSDFETNTTWLHERDRFGKLPLDYIKIEGATYEDKIERFITLLKENMKDFRAPIVPQDIRNALLTSSKVDIKSRGFTVHAFLNPNRPRTSLNKNSAQKRVSILDNKNDNANAYETTKASRIDTNKGQGNTPKKMSSTTSLAQVETHGNTAMEGPPLDSKYLKENLGNVLTEALGHLVMKNPADPIEYLAMHLRYHKSVSSHMQQIAKESQILEMERTEAIRNEEKQRLLLYERRELITLVNKDQAQNSTNVQSDLQTIDE